MAQTIVTMVSLMAAAGAICVIAYSLAQDWSAVRHALGAREFSAARTLPARTRRLPAPRRARMVRLMPESAATRAAA